MNIDTCSQNDKINVTIYFYYVTNCFPSFFNKRNFYKNIDIRYLIQLQSTVLYVLYKNRSYVRFFDLFSVITCLYNT